MVNGTIFFVVSMIFYEIFRIIYFYRHLYPENLEQSGEMGSDGVYTVDDRGTKKYLFKKRSTSSTCAVNISRDDKGELPVRKLRVNIWSC